MAYGDSMNMLPLHIRKPLTDLQRTKMFRDHGGICCICGHKIDGVREKWIDEHERALAMGGSNDPDNRGPAHLACAKLKTKDDMAQISEAKRREAKHNGAKRPRGKIPSRGFRQQPSNTKQLDWGDT